VGERLSRVGLLVASRGEFGHVEVVLDIVEGASVPETVEDVLDLLLDVHAWGSDPAAILGMRGVCRTLSLGMIDASGIKAVTFDCFGTLIDWETGILQAVRPVLAVHGVRAGDDEVLRVYAGLEAGLERVATRVEHRSYRDVLRGVMRGIGNHYGIELIDREVERLPESLVRWPVFSDTATVLRALGARYRLAVLSNVDEDLFEGVRGKLGVEFEEVVTAEMCRSYKPDPRHFRVALALLGLKPGEVLHVAESVAHDVVPARAMGIPCVWVNRRGARGPGASGELSDGSVVPDVEVRDLHGVTRLLGMK
jgi:2-haloacid dehalogenase